MPKNKFQDVIFTIIMVFVMVYVMICYNIALNIGGMKNEVFLSAFHELVIMGPLAFILDSKSGGGLHESKGRLCRIGAESFGCAGIQSPG